ncbi:hypothetical protein CAOG_01059, partial [Capsaspora owczarzaki ATCC 30864]|uniref:hypothetical protein n=1 Tax=Capsaspora owczarzaki (strain ATCC 30864) TaxID=595528 RepID=UPI0001FE5388
MAQAQQPDIPSLLLSDDEMEQVRTVLGARAQAVVTAVAQVHLAQNPRSWSKIATGALAFVRDKAARSYFIRLIDIEQGTVRFQQELYTECVYKCPRPLFHSFAGDKCMVGLAFADQTEATNFKNAVQGQLDKVNKRKTVAPRNPAPRPASSPSPQPGLGSASVSISGPMAGSGQVTLNSLSGKGSTTSLSSQGSVRDKKKGKFSKADIGAPSDFRHVGHIGWSPEKGFDVTTFRRVADALPEG